MITEHEGGHDTDRDQGDRAGAPTLCAPVPVVRSICRSASAMTALYDATRNQMARQLPEVLDGVDL